MISIDVLKVILAKGAGDATLKKINQYLRNEGSCSLKEVCSSEQLLGSMGIRPDVAYNICSNGEKAKILQNQLYKNDVDMCWIGDDNYPSMLEKLNPVNIPAVLFYKGNFRLLRNKSVGFTGSRKVSDSGIRITDNSARQLSANGITIVSGYAKGVDLTAHRAALLSGGNTIFVIVEGILKNRVKNEVRDLLDDENYLFVSQVSPNLTWSASNAMRRNNTIIGLADAMILIESGMNGGTFNAGEQSLKNRKPLFVVEYGVDKPSAVGNHYFLEHGAIPLKGDRNGKPVLNKVYSALDRECDTEKYEQLSIDFSGE